MNKLSPVVYVLGIRIHSAIRGTTLILCCVTTIIFYVKLLCVHGSG